MKPIERSEVLPLGDYEAVRDRFRTRVIEQKKKRRVSVGEHMTVTFENRDTVLLQIQEMLRTERITREDGIVHEMATYNELVPSDDELSMTLFIEVPDKTERDALLEACAGMEKTVFLEVDGARSPAIPAEKAGAKASRTTAVQYYKVPLGPLKPAGAQAAEWLERANEVQLVIDHPGYRAEAALPRAVVDELALDLTSSG